MIVWLASYPRSGNTFFRIVAKQAFGIETQSIYDDPALHKMGAADVVGHRDIDKPLEALEAETRRYLVKTHDSPSDGRPAIYLVRDGRDSLVSYAHYKMGEGSSHNIGPARLVARRRFKKTLRQLVTSGDRFQSWSEHVESWLKREAPTSIVRFDELAQRPLDTVFTALVEVGFEVDKAERAQIPTFEELHDRWPSFFRCGRSGAWKSEMRGHIQQLFWIHHGTTMERLGYCDRSRA